ncbi:sigma-54-dependent Fis family transcriptional regulator [bacterium]|nr:MAG: sigma-54-dependent Fis family transcriptional regulator [bacterium]
MKGRVLIVDDDHSFCEMLAADLEDAAYEPAWTTSPKEGLERALSEEFDAVITDLNMHGLNGIDFCHRLSQNRPDLPVIVITGFGSMETAVAAIRAGAYDFITKPLETEAVALALDRAIQHRSLRGEVKRLREAVRLSQEFEEMLGASAPMKRLFQVLDKVAGSNAGVLIAGETGSGKELVAHALHRRSPRAKRPFVAVNCAAMPPHLLESELFGHVRGAFTDAKAAHPGLFVQSDGGTLFLDEIGELPMELQPKLLRVLEEGCVRPVGGTTEVAFDVRIMAATNRDLEAAAEEHRFREDLLFRINVIQISVPALRARGNDVLLLAQHFVDEYAARLGRPVTGLTSTAADKLMRYAWPGNVRELRNCIERAIILTEHDKIVVEDLPDRVRDYRRAELSFESSDGAELPPMDEVEKRYIERVLHEVGGNKAQAARILGYDRKRLYRKLKRYDISADEAHRG